MLGSTLIFWEAEIQPFKAATGVQVTPMACELIDGRTGYFLGSDWQAEIEAKGVTVEGIEKVDIKQDEVDF